MAREFYIEVQHGRDSAINPFRVYTALQHLLLIERKRFGSIPIGCYDMIILSQVSLKFL